MPLRLADLAKERRALTIHTVAGDLNLVYRPNSMTTADQAQLAESKGVESFRLLLKFLADMVIEWDLTGPLYNKTTGEEVVATDAPVPVKPEVMQHIGTDVLELIYTEIRKDKTPNERSSPTKSGDIFAGSFS